MGGMSRRAGHSPGSFFFSTALRFVPLEHPHLLNTNFCILISVFCPSEVLVELSACPKLSIGDFEDLCRDRPRIIVIKAVHKRRERLNVGCESGKKQNRLAVWHREIAVRPEEICVMIADVRQKENSRKSGIGAVDTQCGDYSVAVSDDLGSDHLEQFSRMTFGLSFYCVLLLVAEFLRFGRDKCLVVNGAIKCKNSFFCAFHRQDKRGSIKVWIENQKITIALSSHRAAFAVHRWPLADRTLEFGVRSSGFAGR